MAWFGIIFMNRFTMFDDFLGVSEVVAPFKGAELGSVLQNPTVERLRIIKISVV